MKAHHRLKAERIMTGLYKVVHNGRTYLVENVGPDTDTGKPQWNISEQRAVNGMLGRTEAFDAANTLRDAVDLISGF